jgi:hypothetical protein
MEKHGRGKRRTFSAEYKAEAVRLVGESGKSIGVIALELGLGETALRECVGNFVFVSHTMKPVRAGGRYGGEQGRADCR